MKTLISGHRIQKLEGYDKDWIKSQLEKNIGLCTIGLSGMASGVDLWFCEGVLAKGGGYYSYVPFEGQEKTMSDEDSKLRERLLDQAWQIKKVRNSKMVEDADKGIIVWDGNKGGTHNVFQQMIECGKPFVWIEPKNKRVYKINE